MILGGLQLSLEIVDITAPGMEDQKDFMRTNSKKKHGESHPIPPQIFVSNRYCGVSKFYVNLRKMN